MKCGIEVMLWMIGVARLLLGILENALHDFLGYRSPKQLVDQAADFIYDDNAMFELCMSIIGYG
jgi:hypothetical protein